MIALRVQSSLMQLKVDPAEEQRVPPGGDVRMVQDYRHHHSLGDNITPAARLFVGGDTFDAAHLKGRLVLLEILSSGHHSGGRIANGKKKHGHSMGSTMQFDVDIDLPDRRK